MSDKFTIQIGLKQDALSPLLFNFALECPREPGRTDIDADDVNILGENIDTTQKNTKAPI
jgi:hypothetical protein